MRSELEAEYRRQDGGQAAYKSDAETEVTGKIEAMLAASQPLIPAAAAEEFLARVVRCVPLLSHFGSRRKNPHASVSVFWFQGGIEVNVAKEAQVVFLCLPLEIVKFKSVVSTNSQDSDE